MAVIKTDLENNLIFLSHEKYLETTYNLENSDNLTKLFNIKTPFRMDGEAMALAKRLTGSIVSYPGL